MYNSEGNEISWEESLELCSDFPIVFFGELHNSTLTHFLQYELFKALNQTGKWALAMEMLEADQQELLDEYRNGLISTKAFEQDARLWNNYAPDYKMLVDYAVQEKLPILASNIPRRYANAIYHGKDLDELREDVTQSEYLPSQELKIDSSAQSYQSIVEMTAGMHETETKTNLLGSQAVKDAVMAERLCVFRQNVQLPILHLNGKYHSDGKEGILTHLGQYCGLQAEETLVITCHFEEEFPEVLPEEILAKGDIIILLNKNYDAYEK